MYDKNNSMKLLKGECKKSNIIAIITLILAIVSIIINIILAIENRRFKIQLIKAQEPQPTKEIEILADSIGINGKYETQALIKIGNLGLTREKEFRFEIKVDLYSEIVSFISRKNLIIEVEEKKKKNCRTYVATLYGQDSIEGTLIFRSNIKWNRGEISHPIDVSW